MAKRKARWEYWQDDWDELWYCQLKSPNRHILIPPKQSLKGYFEKRNCLKTMRKIAQYAAEAEIVEL